MKRSTRSSLLVIVALAAGAAPAHAACVAGTVGQVQTECFDTVDGSGARFAYPGTSWLVGPTAASFAWDAPTATTVTVEVVPASDPGRPVRQLASGAPATAGSLSWDLADHRGVPVPDGGYHARLLTPERPGSSTALIVDRRPPTLKLTRRPTRRAQALRLRVREHASGIRAVVLVVDGRPRVAISSPARGSGRQRGLPGGAGAIAGDDTLDLTYRPPVHGWRPGRHTFTLSGRDAAGYAAAPLTGTFTIR